MQTTTLTTIGEVGEFEIRVSGTVEADKEWAEAGKPKMNTLWAYPKRESPGSTVYYMNNHFSQECSSQSAKRVADNGLRKLCKTVNSHAGLNLEMDQFVAMEDKLTPFFTETPVG
jgi:hypothetical protein